MAKHGEAVMARGLAFVDCLPRVPRGETYNATSSMAMASGSGCFR